MIVTLKTINVNCLYIRKLIGRMNNKIFTTFVFNNFIVMFSRFLLTVPGNRHYTTTCTLVENLWIYVRCP